MPDMTMKSQPDRLYGRQRGHALRPRQQRLLDLTLPRLRYAGPSSLRGVAPLWLEIGFGGGEHAVAQIEAHPDVTLIACEVFENGLCSLLSRLLPEPLDEETAPLPGHLRVWDDDARPLLRDLPDQVLDRVFLMFPDPWPKARHAKRRFVHPENAATLARVMKPGAEWRIASDDPTYQAWVPEVMERQTAFELLGVSDERPEGWPPTRYEAKAIRAGRQPLYWRYVRR
ncbi:tRNA (m(7)G46) methyltransferase [Granulibacter bethesdensis]|uniref:tRNA (guanine(46)-N(7))-methyltransferase TrmB n=1 Tax=Granulibacter bethesdensis TaxID=364410 RepID=UPI00090C1375|nr:tRNA (guanine(46)-N(7))-methyltransferase TrmB [Granulibacter bethesdensis]APH58244.1 tRNA (m(7)G46) methyltransferase [Granulibacter bethesdensis]